MTTDDWPTHAEELERKSIDQFQRWSIAYAAKRLSRREMWLVTNLLYNATSGLISSDVSQIFSNAQKELESGH